MAIGNAIEKGSFVCIYDENGLQTASVTIDPGSNDRLKGYTSTAVNIRRGTFIFTHDEKGRVIRSISAM